VRGARGGGGGGGGVGRFSGGWKRRRAQKQRPRELLYGKGRASGLSSLSSTGSVCVRLRPCRVACFSSCSFSANTNQGATHNHKSKIFIPILLSVLPPHATAKVFPLFLTRKKKTFFQTFCFVLTTHWHLSFTRVCSLCVCVCGLVWKNNLKWLCVCSVVSSVCATF